MWFKGLLWKFIIRNAARKHGIIDPVDLLSHLQNFAQPSEVTVPVELLRAGIIFHARGLINSQAIQHNLDWIWPYWVQCQFNPVHESFIPRAFSITHINLTHRNWTAVGLPDTKQWPIVDPRGLVTPFWDGWSIDAWIIPENGDPLFPSDSKQSSQRLIMKDNLIVSSEIKNNQSSIISNVDVSLKEGVFFCNLNIRGQSSQSGWLAIVLRPYNPEGISFIHEIEQMEDHKLWKVNKKELISFDQIPDQTLFSSYKQGDVYSLLNNKDKKFSNDLNKNKHIKCKVGLATAAALFPLQARTSKEVNLHVPVEKDNKTSIIFTHSWRESLADSCLLNVPDNRFQFLFDASIRTLVLFSPNEVYPGPYTYRRFWFRDAAFILYSMLCMGLTKRVKRALDTFPEKQTPLGYFLSQDGEWDSNGEALWIMGKYCQLTGEKPDPFWRDAIKKGARWIMRKRLRAKPQSPHAGLLPPGFSAEHLGPNDYYYWDDFWGVAGLNAAAYLAGLYGDHEDAKRYAKEANDFWSCIEASLDASTKSLDQLAMAASPYRRLDAGAIGSIVSGYPLQLLGEDEPRLLNTVEFLLKNCMVAGGFFQDMTHSGINPYLTLHMAQILLRAGDSRYFKLMQTVADLASPTGQWPEAIHPRTKTGCMGDGQHAWSSAEWALMIRNCFVREEFSSKKLVLCSGIPQNWLNSKRRIVFGETLTSFGPIRLEIRNIQKKITISWEGHWRNQEPIIEIALPGYSKKIALAKEVSITFDEKESF